MKVRVPLLFVSGLILSWLPYLALRLYWQYLVITVPDALHGEFSGPAFYFLPRLLTAAISLSLLLVSAWFFVRSNTTRNPDDRSAQL